MNIKKKKSSVDNEKELKKMISFEINSQLNNYSIAHFKKVKENLNIIDGQNIVKQKILVQ